VLDAKKFAPAGEFHIDANANALKDGVYSINAVAIAMLNLLPSKRVLPAWHDAIVAPLASTPGGRVSSQALQQHADDAKQKYQRLHEDRVNKEHALTSAWNDVINGASDSLKRAHASALDVFDKANTAWESAKTAEDTTPSDANRKAVSRTSEARFREKQAYEQAHENVLNGVSPTLRDAWRRASGASEDAAWREGVAKEGWEAAQRATAP